MPRSTLIVLRSAFCGFPNLLWNPDCPPIFRAVGLYQGRLDQLSNRVLQAIEKLVDCSHPLCLGSYFNGKVIENRTIELALGSCDGRLAKTPIRDKTLDTIIGRDSSIKECLGLPRRL